MDNFNFKKFLAEGKLNENMFDVTATEKIAQKVADAFTADDDLDLKYVVNPRIASGHFDLDVEAGFNTPDQDSLGQDIDNYLGEFAGGSFYIKDGVVYNAAMRNAPVANVTPEGEVEMISAEDSRAAIGMEENKNELKSNKMKKSELKEMIKSAFLNEKETFDQAFDRIDKEKEVYPGEKPVKEADLNIKDETNMYDPVAEQEDVEVEDDENVDVNVEKDVEVDVDDESTETDTVVKTELPGEDAEVTKTLGLLTKAQQTAKALGDDKLTDQIGNTITYFTRAHVARQQTDEVKVNEVTFPMWSKINK